MAKQTQRALDTVIPAEAKKSSTAMQLMTQAPQYLQRAEQIQVTNPAQHAAACEFLSDNAARLKEVEKEREAINSPLHAAWKASCNFFTRLAEPFNSVDEVVRRKVRVYEKGERDKAEQQRRDNEAAAQRERDRLAADAKEAQRIADQKAADARKEADRLKQEKEDTEREAERHRLAGNPNKAAELRKVAQQAGTAAAKAESKAEKIETAAVAKVENLQQRATTIVATIVDAPALKAEGRKSRKVWKWKVKDLSKVDRRFLALDDPKVNALVRSMHKEAESLLGDGAIEVWEEDDLSITAAK